MARSGKLPTVGAPAGAQGGDDVGDAPAAQPGFGIRGDVGGEKYPQGRGNSDIGAAKLAREIRLAAQRARRVAARAIHYPRPILAPREVFVSRRRAQPRDPTDEDEQRRRDTQER